MSFYVTLPSNGSQQYFPENRAGNYKIKLPYPVRVLSNSHEVALTEFTYVCSIKTLTGIGEDNLIEFTGTTGGFIDVPLQHYSTIQQLIHTINKEFEKHQLSSFLRYHDVKRRVSFQLEPGYDICISEKLSDILGFDGRTQFEADLPSSKLPSINFARFQPDLYGGRYHMFIYCDIIHHQIVGSTTVPLLRMVNFGGEEGQAVTHTFTSPFYIPISRSDFDIISVLLCDEFGEELPIDKGQVTLTLHFKPKSS